MDEDDTADAAAAAASPAALAAALAGLVRKHGRLLVSHAEAVRALAALAGDVMAAPSAGEKAVTDAVQALQELCSSEVYGSTQLSAAVLKELLPCLLYGRAPSAATGLKSQSTLTKLQKDCRANAMDVALACADSPTSPACAALSRQLVLRAPERADLHAHAVEAARDLVITLPLAERHRMGRFLAKLSKNAKPARRQVAAELAGELLASMPGASEDIPLGMEEEVSTPGSWGERTPGGALTPGGGARTPGSIAARSPYAFTPGGGTPYATTPASAAASTPGSATPLPSERCRLALPWGVSCAGVVVARASDKAPAVRAKALQGLSAALRALTAEGFHALVGKAASASPGTTILPTGAATDMALGFINPSEAGTGTGDAPSTGAATPVGPTPMETEGVLGRGSARSQLALAPLLYRRTTDAKPAVRKAALQALEALCVSAGRASREDVAALSACCADAMVSVRRQAAASLGAMCAGIGGDATVAAAVADTVLPLAADPERQVSDKAAEVCEEVFLAPLLGADANAAASTLGALATAPTAASALPKALAALHAKKAIKPAHVKALQQAAQQGAAPAARVGALALLAELADCAPGAVSSAFLWAQWQTLSADSNVEDDTSMADVLRILAKCGAAALKEVQVDAIAEALSARLSACLTSPATAAAMLGAARALGAPVEPIMRAAGAAVVRAVAAGAVGGDEPADAPVAAPLVSALFTLGEAALALEAAAPADAVTMTQALLGARLVSHSDGSGSVRVPSVVRAHAWAALGKLCVAHEPLAKKCAVLFVDEAEKGAEAAARNNALVALTDLCVKFTSVVDGRMDRLAACLRDPCELVRRQAMLLLSSLLQRDYLKWRGAVFHRFCLALVDESPAVRDLAQHLLSGPLAGRAPGHFIEAFFVLNACTAGPGASADVPAEARERALFCLEGIENRMRRLGVYRRLLSAMPGEQAFSSCAKLAQEVVGAAVDGGLPLEGGDANKATSEVLADALSVLACREASASASARMAAEGEAESAAAAVAAAKGRMVASLARRHVQEQVAPLLVELRQLLAQKRHALQGHLLACAADVLRPFKADIKTVLAADAQFAAEVADELRRRQQSVAPAQALKTPPPTQAVARQAASAPGAGAPRGTSPATVAKTPAAAKPPASPLYEALSGGRTPHGALSVPRLRRGRSGTAASRTPGKSPLGARAAAANVEPAAVLPMKTPENAAGRVEQWRVSVPMPEESGAMENDADAENTAPAARASPAAVPGAGGKRKR